MQYHNNKRQSVDESIAQQILTTDSKYVKLNYSNFKLILQKIFTLNLKEKDIFLLAKNE